MDQSRSKLEPTEVNPKSGTVRLSVAGQLIDVSWEDLLEPSKWFTSEPDADAPQE